MKRRRLQSLGKDISGLQSTTDVLRRDKTKLESIPNQVAICLDMLLYVLEDRIGDSMNSSLTINEA